MGAGLLSLASVGLFLWLIWDGLDKMGKEKREEKGERMKKSKGKMKVKKVCGREGERPAE